MNLKRVSIRNEIFFRRHLSLLNSISHQCKRELRLKCRSGLKLNLDSCELPLSDCLHVFIYMKFNQGRS